MSPKGQEHIEEFVNDRLKINTKPLIATINRNKVLPFNKQSYRSKKGKAKFNVLYSEFPLFSGLYVACQTRDGDLDIFFSHANHPFPPSLSSYGSYVWGNKSDLMICQEKHVHSRSEARPEADVSVIDDAVLVNILTFRPIGCKTLGDYVAKLFLPYVKRQKNMT